MKHDEYERSARRFAKFIVLIVVACVATIFIGLSITLPWLGIPLSILAVIGYFLMR